MNEDGGPFGVEELDRLLYDHYPEGGVVEIRGPSGSGKTILGLGFLSLGIGRDIAGLYLQFSSVPILPLLKKNLDNPTFSHLLDYDEPFVFDMTDESRLDLLPSILSSGEIKNLVMDHPDILPMKMDGKWFAPLELALSSARENGANVVMLNYPGSFGQFFAEGVLDIYVEKDGRKRIDVIKWDWNGELRGRSIKESEVGTWRI